MSAKQEHLVNYIILGFQGFAKQAGKQRGIQAQWAKCPT